MKWIINRGCRYVLCLKFDLDHRNWKNWAKITFTTAFGPTFGLTLNKREAKELVLNLDKLKIASKRRIFDCLRSFP